MKFNTFALSLAVLLSTRSCESFAPSSGKPLRKKVSTSSTELYIIGPMLRKMREEKAKKNMPMASDEEREGEAPGLRVGGGAWKWPPVWPYTANDFTPKDDIVVQKDDNPMSAIMGGGAPPVQEVVDDKDKLDSLKFWGEDKASEKTTIDSEAIDQLKK